MSELSVGQLKGLPANSNVVTVPAGHTLYAPGHVLQVVSATKTNTFSFSSSTFGATSPITGLNVSITPKYSSSKILIIASVNSAATNSRETGIILTGTTTPVISDAGGIAQRATAIGQATITNYSISFLDSPNTTSPINYGISVINLDNQAVSTTIQVNRYMVADNGRAISSITALEIAA